MAKNFYAVRRNEFGKTWAILDEEKNVVLCDWLRANKWRRKEGGEQRSLIKFNRIGSQEIETRFVGESMAVDGPHLFWQVHLRLRPVGYKKGTLPFALAADLMKEESPLKQGISRFGSCGEALKFHEESRQKMVQWTKERRPSMPELAEELLAQLSRWCEQAWGRQARVAREVGTTAQNVNHWLNGRKKMTGEQALRVQKFLAKQGRAKS